MGYGRGREKKRHEVHTKPDNKSPHNTCNHEPDHELHVRKWRNQNFLDIFCESFEIQSKCPLHVRGGDQVHHHNAGKNKINIPNASNVTDLRSYDNTKYEYIQQRVDPRADQRLYPYPHEALDFLENECFEANYIHTFFITRYDSEVRLKIAAVLRITRLKTLHNDRDTLQSFLP